MARKRLFRLIAAVAIGLPSAAVAVGAQVGASALADSARRMEAEADSLAQRPSPSTAPRALLLYKGALELHRGAGRRLEEGRVLNGIGWIYLIFGRPDSATAYYRQALAVNRANGAREGEGTSLQGLGNVHSQSGRADSALAYYKEALAVRRQTGDRASMAGTLSNIGIAFEELGQPDSALVYYHAGLTMARETRSRVTEAGALQNIGSVHSGLGRPDSALAYYRQALVVHREAENLRGVGGTLHNMGVEYRALGRPDSALTYYTEALGVWRRTGQRAREGGTLGHIGFVHRDAERQDTALVYFREALRLSRETGDRATEASMLISIGSVSSDFGRIDSGVVYNRQALAIFREIGLRAGEATTLLNIGTLTGDLGQPDSALAYFHEALAIYRKIGDPAGEAAVLGTVGRVYLHRFAPPRRDAARAAAYLDSAAAVLASIRRHAGGDANAIGLAEHGDIRRLYHRWALAWLARADEVGPIAAARASLAAAERGRAQALLQLLRRNAREASAISGMSDRVTRPGGNLAAEADSLLSSLRDRRTAALSYVVTDDTLLTWLITPSGEMQVNRVPLEPDTLAMLVGALRSTLGADIARGRMARAPGGGAGDVASERDEKPVAGQLRAAGVGVETGLARADAENALRRLAALLLPAGVQQRLGGARELLIVPQGVLALVPFAALPVGEHAEPLGLRYSLRYAPSFAALAAAPREPSAALASRSAAGEQALVVGDPAMPWIRGDQSGDSAQLRPLAAARAEGQWVADRLGAHALTGPAASETAVRRRLRSASLVHLATHGLAFGTDARARDSYVALAPDAANDGLLTVGELLDDPTLAVSAELVVLSACQTGLGDLKEAEGTVGLQRAFLARGARSVLVSLWSVDDEATRLLMQRFYAHWLAGRPRVSKAEALRRAQQDVRGTKGYEHPRYWAAFQMVGSF